MQSSIQLNQCTFSWIENPWINCPISSPVSYAISPQNCTRTLCNYCATAFCHTLYRVGALMHPLKYYYNQIQAKTAIHTPRIRSPPCSCSSFSILRNQVSYSSDYIVRYFCLGHHTWLLETLMSLRRDVYRVSAAASVRCRVANRCRLRTCWR